MLKNSQGLKISTNSSATVNAINSFVEQLLSMGNELLSRRAATRSNILAIGHELALTYKKLGRSYEANQAFYRAEKLFQRYQTSRTNSLSHCVISWGLTTARSYICD
ncbi:MAG: hypothetical protein CLLPBCKN_006049 [Chroococcidiopsis cubana SAG 39.79]|nr:hypothetical protein [Chroococcidiopsis cubana SAG 39.79]